MSSTIQLIPTYQGFIASTYDALILFEACLDGHINHVARRPHDRERDHVIKSGNIFIYEEHSSGIKRWTDGVSWSPSRILGNFLIYRQLVKPFGPGEKKKALKKSKGPAGVAKNVPTNTRAKNSVQQMFGNPSTAVGIYDQSGQINVDVERSLIGSLVDSYDFMDDGLVKKTISVTVGEVTHHLVSYYTMADAMMTNKFMVPSKDARFQNIHIRTALLTKQNFRAPIEDIDPMDRAVYGRSYNMVNQSMLPAYGSDTQGAYQPPPMYHNYSQSSASQSFENNNPSYTSNTAYGAAQHYAQPPVIYPAPSRQEHYPAPTYYPHRYSTVSTASSDGSRAQMPPTTNNGRRSSNYHPSISSEDSGIGMTMESRPGTDSAFNGASNYYPASTNSSRDVTGSQSTQILHKPLATIENRQPVYDRSLANHAYRISMDAAKDAAIWPMGGNPGAGHAHYQPQWASATH